MARGFAERDGGVAAYRGTAWVYLGNAHLPPPGEWVCRMGNRADAVRRPASHAGPIAIEAGSGRRRGSSPAGRGATEE